MPTLIPSVHTLDATAVRSLFCLGGEPPNDLHSIFTCHTQRSRVWGSFSFPSLLALDFAFLMKAILIRRLHFVFELYNYLFMFKGIIVQFAFEEALGHNFKCILLTHTTASVSLGSTPFPNLFIYSILTVHCWFL